MTVKITRGGEVLIDGARRGWVDKYDQTRRDRKGYTWRGVREGGHTSPRRYPTRAAAAEWVASWD